MTRRFQGMNAWILQRVSAVYLALIFIYIITVFIASPPASYQEYKAWLTHPLVSTGVLIGFAMIFGHAWVGVRDVFMDYIPSLIIRAVALILFAFGLLGCGVWVVRIIVLAMI